MGEWSEFPLRVQQVVAEVAFPAVGAVTAPLALTNLGGVGPSVLNRFRGTGGGDYSSTSLVLVAIDSVNLQVSQASPGKFNISVRVNSGMTVLTAAAPVFLGILRDGVPVVQRAFNATPGNVVPVSVEWVEASDGAAHVWVAAFATGNAANAVVAKNSALVDSPILIIEAVQVTA